MTTQTLIEEIQSKNPQITHAQISERLAAERIKTGGLLGDETLLRLIAAKLGLQVQQISFENASILPSGRLFAGLYDVSIAGRLVAVSSVRTFQGEEKNGKFGTLMLGDNDGLLRVVLWNEKAEFIETGGLKSGQTVRLLHGYTKVDRYGKIELHLGSKSLIEVQPVTKLEDFSPIEKFTSKIASLNANSGSVHLIGTVKAVYGKNSFHKSDNSAGIVMRLAFRDDSGEVIVVVWNEKVEEIERLLRENPQLLLVNARVKESQKGSVEVHVDSNTFVVSHHK
ncbi:MAG: OB-fold nucleic acid binding domain-containing protein [Candidatus Bathyarchaeia archaeon]